MTRENPVTRPRDRKPLLVRTSVRAGTSSLVDGNAGADNSFGLRPRAWSPDNGIGNIQV